MRVVDAPPATKQTRGNNMCLVYPTVDVRTERLVVVSVLDNLVKGAAGQAMQNMNADAGLPGDDGPRRAGGLSVVAMGEDEMVTESAKTKGDSRSSPSGSVTTPRGFTAGAAKVGVRSRTGTSSTSGSWLVEAPCVAAGVYTQNNLKGASLVISMEHLKSGRAQAIVANSGCANCSVGQRGHRRRDQDGAAHGRKVRDRPARRDRRVDRRDRHVTCRWTASRRGSRRSRCRRTAGSISRGRS